MNVTRRTKIHCVSCDVLLNDFESTRKVASTGEYLDMCNRCYSDIEHDVPTVGRSDLNPMEMPDGYELDGVDEADVWLFDNDPDRGV
jgi:hypothetical protein